MSIFESAGFVKAKLQPSLNTGTILDIALGDYVLGVNGEWLLNGGIAPLTAVAGRGGTYKSTTIDSLIVRILMRYPLIEVLKYDTEQNAFTVTRFDKMARTEQVSHRIFLTNQATTDSNEFQRSLKKLFEEREKDKYSYTVETPFLDLDTGKPAVMWIPLIVFIDSFTCLRPSAEEESSKKRDLEDQTNNTNDMRDGKLKKDIVTLFSRWAQRYGLYFLMTAQIGSTIKINQYEVTPKQNQWFKQNDSMKNVGSQFMFLTNTLLQTINPTPILASDKKSAEYPNMTEGNIDINELNVRIIRCKTSPSGGTIPFVMSQNLGILSDLTNYHYLKKNNDFGFNVKGYNRYCVLKPDVKLNRMDIIDTLEKDYELCRALEILTQLKWITTYWNTAGMDMTIPETAEKFVDMIAAQDTLLISDILNSRGYWTFNKEDKRPYMSTMDIIDKIQKR